MSLKNCFEHNFAFKKNWDRSNHVLVSKEKMREGVKKKEKYGTKVSESKRGERSQQAGMELTRAMAEQAQYHLQSVFIFSTFLASSYSFVRTSASANVFLNKSGHFLRLFS